MSKIQKRNRRGNPGTPPEVINAIRFLKEKYPYAPAKALRDKLESRLSGKKYPLPTERTIRNILARAGSIRLEEVDSPWSLGASASHDIPAEASGDLLKIWKWCLIVGRPFTIREAKWVGRLRSTARPENLLFMASLYAIQERMSKGNQQFNSSHLDSWLVFGQSEVWIYRSLQALGIIQGIFRGDKPEEFYGNPWLDWIGEPGKSIEGLLNISPKHVQILTKEADVVYAIWLRLLGQGSRWQSLTSEAKNSLAQRLHNEVATKDRMIKKALSPDRSFSDLSASERQYVAAPSPELLKEAGIENGPAKNGALKDWGVPTLKQLSLIPT